MPLCVRPGGGGELDELIRATRGAHNALLDLEELEDQELLKVRRMDRDLAVRARAKVEGGRADTDTDDFGDAA